MALSEVVFSSGRQHGLPPVFAVFRGLAIAGYFLGSIISNALKATDHWIALGLLSFLGIKMITEGIQKNREEGTKGFKQYNSSL